MQKINLSKHTLKNSYLDIEIGLIQAENLLSEIYMSIKNNHEKFNLPITTEDIEKLNKIAQAIYAIRLSTPNLSKVK